MRTADIPERYGTWKTIYDRSTCWRRNSTWDRIVQALQTKLSATGAPTWDGANEPSDHTLGRSVGGFFTKIHVLSNGNGVPLDAIVPPGQTHESTQLERVLAHVAIPRASGRTRRRPRKLAADRAYDARRIQPVMPSKRRRGRVKPGRPVTYDAVADRRRSTIEQCIGWVKACRAVAMRYKKLVLNYLGLVKLTFIERYLRLLTRPALAV